MNKAFEKYDFPGSSPKKIVVPRVSQKDTQSQLAFQLKLDFMEQDSKDNMEAKGV
ncbi:hypothetical protein JOC85_003066 [Bacillus mesophilus]|uniref:Uncharacterized protein n=1 Tax=Bacillus mesophilus TaxID=1808955 RepID=A0A6M0Q9S1_9BACI|nr:hypothetical protein [Bacillus mesophilus]MBM7662259.1 hypothetical protein [Bacillus mesophilus]NEY73104.1 hypothetical protein [Bacillus mesophilus]